MQTTKPYHTCSGIKGLLNVLVMLRLGLQKSKMWVVQYSWSNIFFLHRFQRTLRNKHLFPFPKRHTLNSPFLSATSLSTSVIRTQLENIRMKSQFFRFKWLCLGGYVAVQFSYRRKCIGYISVQHYNMRRAIQKKEKTDHRNCDRNKSLGHWHWGWSGSWWRGERREVAGLGLMISHTLTDFYVVGSFFCFLILQLWVQQRQGWD